ncbi:MAG: DNA mismatch repair protein MutT [Arcobacter sp.]|nr:MAG: DNA mismatch repair protein MutT [Arcobacter sp.]
MIEKFDFTMIVLKNDQYDGSTIDASTIPDSVEVFEEELLLLIEKLENKKLLWVKLDIVQSNLIPLLTKYDFVFHHCNERDITLVKKLIHKPIIPTATNHTLGVGAVVIDDNKLLVIKDKIWQKYKLPGGHIDDRENISSALIREVYEDTGINVEFDSIVSLGHFSPGQFNESNLYVVCKAKPLSKEINIIDTDEILEARWIEIEAYLSLDDVHPYNKTIVKNALKNEGFKIDESENLITKNDLNYEIFF